MHCKKKNIEMKDVKRVTLKNGKKAVAGKCSICDGKMFKIGGWE
jgi:hypothetical protein